MNDVVKRSVGEVAPRDTVAPILPRTAEEVGAFVDAMIKMEAIPSSYATLPENKRRGHMVVAILKGMELGMPPLRALQSIYVVNGIPTIYGDAVVAYVMRSGQVESYEEWFEGEGELRAAVVKAKRVGVAGAVTRAFSLAQAQRQGLLNKVGPWQHSPDRMMTIRARTYVFRDLFADCLDGLAVAEEQEDIAAARGPAPAAEAQSTRKIDPLADATIEGEIITETRAASASRGGAFRGGDVPHLSQSAPSPAFPGDYVTFRDWRFDPNEPEPIPDWGDDLKGLASTLAACIKGASTQDARTRWLTYNSAALAELTQAAPKTAARLRELATPTESASSAADEGAPEADGMGLSGAPSHEQGAQA